MGEVVCVLGASVPVIARCSHVNLLLRAVTRYVARKPAIWSVGGSAQARISGSACGLEGRHADWRADVRISGSACGLKSRRADWRADAYMSGPTCEMLGVICD